MHGALFTAFMSAVFAASAVPKGQWDAGMDDDAGKAKNTSRSDLPGANTGVCCAYAPVLAALVGYVPGVEIKTDEAKKRVVIKVKGTRSW